MEQLEELGERFVDAESLDEIRGWAEEKRLAKAQQGLYNLSVAIWSRQNAETIEQGSSEGSSVPCPWTKYLKQPGKAFYHMQKYIEMKPGDRGLQRGMRSLLRFKINGRPWELLCAGKRMNNFEKKQGYGRRDNNEISLSLQRHI